MQPGAGAAHVSVVATAILLGWALAARAEDIVIEIDPASIAVAPPGAPDVRVEMSDIRDSVSPERTTLLNVRIGQIDFYPEEVDLVGGIVAAKASQALAAGGGRVPPEVVYAGLRRFSIETPATALYWDIETQIEMVLRVAGRDREVAASATTRTWLYPSKRLIERVTRQALQALATDLEPALRELLAGPVVPEPSTAQ